MTLSPNGNTVALVGGDSSPDEKRKVGLWDVELGKNIVEWGGPIGNVWSVCWSSDGERVVSGSHDGTARVWDVKSGEPVQGLNPIRTGQGRVCVVSYSPNATKTATSGEGKSGIKIWDAKRRLGQRLYTIGQGYTVWSLAWTSDEKKLIAGSNGSIRIFNTATWQQIGVLEGHKHVVYAVTLSRNDRLLASTSWDHTARLWDLDTNLQVGPPLEHPDEVDCAAFSVDGKLLITGCADTNAYMWDINTILSIDARNVELKQVYESSHGSPSIEHIPPSFLEADATQGFDQLGGADELSPGFFDNLSVTPGTRPKFSALLGHFSSLLRRPQPNEAIETQQPPVSSEPLSQALLNRLSSFLRSPPNTDEVPEFPQPPMLSRLRPQVLLGHLSSLLPRSRIHTDEVIGPQQRPTPSGSRPGALISSLSSLFRSPLNADEEVELQQWPRQITSSHCNPHVVEVAAQRDKKALYVARRPKTASENAKRIKNPKPWVRVVLFLCCVSPGTDDSPGTDGTPRTT
ncbi:WD40-repeat-containing domain protein [Suillus clintonianus]|uniref:WD40-repeat-containing domain protein n=1 Tax=Suillus clintonianus TaxID=1904413 RepID=UPI001B87B922|nr:WD40-repeat-containing domain protein [Suillus clintonianus]KAG2135838.1 WD40-repeat-containing domain protein [Suillus clintonianus]